MPENKKLKPITLLNNDSGMVCGPNGCNIAEHQKLEAAKEKKTVSDKQSK